MPPIVTYGLLALLAVAFAFAFWVDGRRDSKWARVQRWVFAIQLGAFGAAYMLLRPGQGGDPRSALALSAARGRPLMVELFSNY